MTVYTKEDSARSGRLYRVTAGEYGTEVRDLVWLDTETGDAIQHVRSDAGSRVIEWDPAGRTQRIKTRHVKLPLPIRVEAI
jgi:hypothetical protein